MVEIWRIASRHGRVACLLDSECSLPTFQRNCRICDGKHLDQEGQNGRLYNLNWAFILTQAATQKTKVGQLAKM